MVVQKVNSGYNVYQPAKSGLAASKQPAKSYQPQFTGGLDATFMSRLKQKKFISILEKLKWFDGEAGRIIITAIGTGAIAPLFIAWNPYVKPKENATEEEKQNLKRTQKYTAMRQPISAALAIPIQLSLVKPVERGLDILFNNPEFSKNLPVYLDKSVLQDEKYLKAQEKKKLKDSGLTGKARAEQISKNVKAIEKAQIESAARGLLATGTIPVREGVDGVVDSRSIILSIKEKIRTYINHANFLKVDSFSDKHLDKLLADPEAIVTGGSDGKDFYQRRATVLVGNKEELRKTLAENLPKDKTQVKAYIKDLYDKTTDAKLKEIYKEILDLPDAEGQISRAARTIERIDRIEEACGGNFTPAKYRAVMENDEKILTQKIKDLVKISKGIEENPESIQKAISEIAETCRYDANNPVHKRIFHDLTTFGLDVNELKSKICKDVVNGYKDIMKKRYRFFKELAGISLGLFLTVPVTCHALNWVYPRFMDIFFPKLAGKQREAAQAKNGGEK